MPLTKDDLEDFSRFASERLENAEAESLDELVTEWEKRRRWHEGNRIAMEQSRLGLSKPLDDQAVLSRLRERLAKEGISD